ncbi:MAG: hypothetical protein MK102_14745 [Fuerstiella sp.]|nr:hypothetical protein [Fuerstiella sp.]
MNRCETAPRMFIPQVCVTCILFVLTVATADFQVVTAANKDDSEIDVGLENQLLFDDALIESKQGFRTTMNPATRMDKPVLEPHRDWERYGCFAPTVLSHDDTYHMWYGATGEDHESRLCYATSEDGIRWQRADLRLHEYKGSRETNIVFSHYGSVFFDSADTSGRNFKMIGGWREKYQYRNLYDGGARFRYEDPPPATWHYTAVSGAYSPDGIHWTECSRNPIMPWYTDTRNVAFRDDRTGKYVAYVRWNEHFRVEDGVVKGSFDYRAIARAESDDFENFPTPEKIMEPDFSNPEDKDLWGGGLYDSAAMKYPFAANVYFIFTAAYHHTSDTLDIQLAVSRDGKNFHRWHEPFVRLGREGAFDSSMIYMGVGMLPIGDEIWMYYGGYDQLHDQARVDSYRSAIGRVKVRRDGFVSQDAPAEGGVLTTRPFRLQGNHLVVNMDASSRGGLRVEILDEAGRVIPGYSRVDADRLDRNDLRKVVTWKGDSTLSMLEGKKVRLRFIGERVKVYAFQFVE